MISGRKIDNWQHFFVTWVQKNKYLLETEEMSDITFSVGLADNKTTIKGHRLILSAASPVFHELLSTNKGEPIIVNDVDEVTFKILLECIYMECENITFPEIPINLYKAAHKYSIDSIKNKCIENMLNELKVENVLHLYSFAEKFNEMKLKKKCTSFWCENTKAILKDSNFLLADIETITNLYEENNMEIDNEKDLYEALDNYYANSKDLTALQGALKQIRFLTMTPKIFIELLSTSKLIMEAESFQIISNIISPHCGISYPKNYNRSRHVRYKHNWNVEFTIKRFLTDLSTLWIKKNGEASLEFEANMDLMLIGVVIPTQNFSKFRADYNYKEHLVVSLINGSDTIAMKEQISLNNRDSMQTVKFDDSVLIQTGKVYKIQIVFYNQGSYISGIGLKQLIYEDVTVDVKNGIDDGVIQGIVFLRESSTSTKKFEHAPEPIKEEVDLKVNPSDLITDDDVDKVEA